MTPRERWRATLRREAPDRVPMDYWATQEATERVMAYLGCQDVWEVYDRLHIDPVIEVSPRYVGPPLGADFNIYGCQYVEISYGVGSYSECVSNPLAKFQSVEEIEDSYTWPSADWFDYSDVSAQLNGMEAYPVRAGGSEPFWIYSDLRGREQAYLDLLLNPTMVHYCLGKVFDFCYENTRRLFEQLPGRVDITYVAEDLGSQQNLLVSPEMIWEFFLPGMKRMIDLAHEAEVYAFFHSDGAIREVIPDLIEAGIDILNPIQWRCKGMDRKELKRDFGHQVIFHGGVDNQQTLAFRSVMDVREEVEYNLDVLGEDGGYILAPCHNIQVVSPPENVVAMYEAGFEYGRI